MNDDYQLGQHVTYSEHLIRRAGYDEGAAYNARYTKNWTSDKYGFPGSTKTDGGQGIIIGKRTLANGVNHYNGDDEPITFIPKERFTAYLVAYDLHRKPVYVRPEHLTPAEPQWETREAMMRRLRLAELDNQIRAVTPPGMIGTVYAEISKLTTETEATAFLAREIVYNRMLVTGNPHSIISGPPTYYNLLLELSMLRRHQRGEP